MLVSFTPGTLLVSTGEGKNPVISLRSTDPITTDVPKGTGAVKVLGDGLYSVTLSATQSEAFAALMAAARAGNAPDFVAAIEAGSLTLSDARKGRRAVRGESILALIAPEEPEEEPEEPETATDTTSAPKGRRKAS